MKKIFYAAAVLCFILGITTNATFIKTNTYKDGMFTDIKGGAWYETDIAAAFELGFMNGTSQSTMSPDKSVTVAEAITIASRMNAIYYGREDELSKKGERWYTPYISYAEKYGIVKGLSFDDYTREAKRYEAVSLFANAFEDGYYTGINHVDSISDIEKDEAFYESVLLLYKAGVITGNDESGTFYPDNTIKRSEISAIISRVAYPEKRVVKNPMPTYMDKAVYLVDDTIFAKERFDGHGYELIHGWNIDDRGSETVNKYASYNGSFSDSSDKAGVSIYRYITPVSKGRAVFEASVFLKNAGKGFEVGFYDGENCVVKLYTDKGMYGLYGKEQKLGQTRVYDESAKIKIELDLDKKMADLYVNASFVCSTEIADFESINKVSVGSDGEAKLMFSPERIALYINYLVNDSFMFYKENRSVVEYETDGNVKTAKNESGDSDNISVMMNGKSRAVRSFDSMKDGFVSEVYLLKPESSKAYIAVGEKRLEMCDGKYLLDGKNIHTYTENVWQCIRFERDSHGIVTVRICGKDVYTYKYDGAVSSVEIGNESGTLLFDDVKCYNTYEFSDYVPMPKAQNKNDDLTVCMSVCSLWHEGSHYGWDYVSPYDELIPVLGFYDEGLSESADWEIKYMVESGIDALQPCWYASSTTSPMKHPRLNRYAIHDGYFNATYKDMLDICIMWENQGVTSGMTLEKFKTYIWNYWVDWYFKDPGYMCFDNKPVLTIYQYDSFVNCFGSAQEAKKVMDFMREDIRNYGYDGIIILFNIYTSQQARDIIEKSKEQGIEADGLLPYHWGINAHNPDYIKSQHLSAYVGKGDIPTIATASTGRNIIGWEQTRSPIATYEQHLETLEFLTQELLPIYENDFGKASWQSKLLFLGTWNEFAEGHWLMPTGVNGKGPEDDYMRAWKKVFTGTESEIVYPTQAQKERISYLYPAVITPIRAELTDTPEDTYESKTDLVSAFDFSAPEAMSKLSFVRYDSTKIVDGVFFGKAESEQTKKDPSMSISAFSGINAGSVDVIHIRMKADIATTVNVYPMFNDDTAYSTERMMTQRYTNIGLWQDIYFETSEHSFWNGEINKLRFDLINSYGNVECDTIELLRYAEKDTLIIDVDGVKLDINHNYIFEEENEVYVAALPSEGLYSALNIIYEWHRFDGVLKLWAGVGEKQTDFVFTEGDDKCLVNGKEIKLKKPFYLFDKIPVLPLKFLLENAKIDYVYEKGKRLYSDVREYEAHGEETTNHFNFDDSSSFGITAKRANAYVYDGALYVVPKKLDGGRFDPIIELSDVMHFSAENCENITVRMKYDTNGRDDNTSMYFATATDSVFDENKAVKVKLSRGMPDSDGFFVYTFNMSECTQFKGKITSLRFDPANLDGEYIIDYIKVNMKE